MDIVRDSETCNVEDFDNSLHLEEAAAKVLANYEKLHITSRSPSIKNHVRPVTYIRKGKVLMHTYIVITWRKCEHQTALIYYDILPGNRNNLSLEIKS